MSVQSELTRLKRDVDSLTDELATSLGPNPRLKLAPAERRAYKADLQALIQRLDELAGKLSG